MILYPWDLKLTKLADPVGESIVRDNVIYELSLKGPHQSFMVLWQFERGDHCESRMNPHDGSQRVYLFASKLLDIA